MSFRESWDLVCFGWMVEKFPNGIHQILPVKTVVFLSKMRFFIAWIVSFLVHVLMMFDICLINGKSIEWRLGFGLDVSDFLDESNRDFVTDFFLHYIWLLMRAEYAWKCIIGLFIFFRYSHAFVIFWYILFIFRLFFAPLNCWLLVVDCKLRSSAECRKNINMSI